MLLQTQYDDAHAQHYSRAAKKQNLLPNSVGFGFPVHAKISRRKAISVKRVIRDRSVVSREAKPSKIPLREPVEIFLLDTVPKRAILPALRPRPPRSCTNSLGPRGVVCPALVQREIGRAHV